VIFAHALCLGTLALCLSLGDFRLITSAQDASPDNFHSRYFAREFHIGDPRCKTSIWELLAWELSFGFFGLGSLAWVLWLGIFGFGSLAWDLWLGIFGLGSLASYLVLGIFGFDLWLGIFGFGALAWPFGFASLAWDLRLGAFELGFRGLIAELGSWGNRWEGSDGTWPGELQPCVFKTPCKNHLGEPY